MYNTTIPSLKPDDSFANVFPMIHTKDRRSDTFEAQIQRVFAITGARTQVELAALLDIKQSTIANSKKRKNVPDRWLIRLLCRHHVNPAWILTGEGHRYLTAAPVSSETDILEVVRNLPTRTLAEELLRRIDSLEKKP